MQSITLHWQEPILSFFPRFVTVCIHPKEQYIGQYHLSSGAWSAAIVDDCSQNNQNDGFTAQGPCSLIQHIFTCCSRTYWNKGLLWCRQPYYPSWNVKGEFRNGA